MLRLALVVSLVAAGPLLAQSAPQTGLRKATLYEDLQMFSQVLNQIRVNHFDSVDVHSLILAAVEGMVHAADPHSYVLPAARLSPEKAHALEDGKLIALPVTFRFIGGSPVVARVLPLSRAAGTDILPGDELIAIDGQPVSATTSEELDVALAGEKNSTVRLRLSRYRGDGSSLEVERLVKRERVGEETAVPVARLLGPETGYVRITTFNNVGVADDLHDAIGRLKSRGMKRLVLDLRDNGGGYVDQAAQVAGVFLPSGAVVYTTEQRKEAKIDTVKVKRSFWQREDRYPLIVLVNEGTASASELVAGALQDHDRALIVGRPTFGKSLMMRPFPLTDGSVIMLAFGRVRTPCGRILQREYRDLTRRDYYRLAGAARDTAGRPSCRTPGGRTVYGGGGVYPDLRLDDPPGYPLWLARLLEEDLPLKWAGGYLSAATVPPLDSLAARPVPPAGALADFRQFAQARGLEIPAGAEVDARLERLLVQQIAYTRWGELGLAQLATALDPVIRDAAKYFDRATQVLGVTH
ncbi:MAG TPA: S41 family peptidase [Gemmatimonadales bacterium]|nr:S41 family peptidase [Gemmatimonadales bacterium]